MTGFIAPEIQWAALSPALVVLGAAVVGVLVEAFAPRRGRRTVQIVIALAATAGAFVLIAWRMALTLGDGGAGQLLVSGQVVEDGPALFAQATVALLAFIGILVIADRTSAEEDHFAPQGAAVPGSEYEDQARRLGLTQTEVYPLLLFSIGGMIVFPAAGDLLTLFIALEVLSLPLYLLAGLARRRRLLSQEASLKYFVLGAFSSALLLFGIALLFGYSGSIRLNEIGVATTLTTGMDGLLVAGFVLLLVGLLFKVGAVPFHAWTPDVYQGAPTPVTGFMAAATKVAAFGALLRVVYVAAPSMAWDITPFLWGVAILSMIVGTVLAIVQTDMKRTLAYSSIAHAGFVLIGVTVLLPSGISSVLIHLLAYGFATIGAFAIVTLVREQDAEGGIRAEASHLSQWAGLGRRSPLLATVFALFLLSFAGIPLTGGFIGKFALFSAGIEGGAWPLVLVGVLASAAAAFFYVRVIVLMFFTEPPEAGEGASQTTLVTSRGPIAAAVAICAIATLVLGIWPSPVLDLAALAAKFIV